VKVWLHSTGDASSRAALLLPQILPVFWVVAPCSRGALARLGATPDFHHGLLGGPERIVIVGDDGEDDAWKREPSTVRGLEERPGSTPS
jgi:hypothetical protein